jgi:hypothetical protein
MAVETPLMRTAWVVSALVTVLLSLSLFVLMLTAL